MRLIATLLLLTLGLNAQTITIAPAPVDRAALVVQVKVARCTGDVLSARDATGREYDLQADDDDTSTLVLGFVPANQTTTLKVATVASTQPHAIKVGPGEDGLTVSIDGQDVLILNARDVLAVIK